LPRVCAVCASEHRDAIEDAFLEGQPKTRIASNFGIGEHSIRYHLKEGHLSKLMALARDAQRAARADTLLDRAEALQSRTETILDEAESSRDLRTALAAIAQCRANLELIGEITKELNRMPTLNLHLNPEWLQVEAVIVHALDRYPDAQEAVVRALGDLSQEGMGSGAGGPNGPN